MNVPPRMASLANRKLMVAAIGVILLVAAIAVALYLGQRVNTPRAQFQQASRSSLPPKLPPIPGSTLSPMSAPDIAPDEARLLNANIPFSKQPNEAARPFVFSGSPTERESALTCLASALWYEAGDDAVGQMAVAQVILNRLRHPAFDKTICGVVFHGSERKTGCQFTFTCDGALNRTPSAAAWQRARDAAEMAMSGYVFKPVGTATHYHTDWVIPYWAPTLDKITMIHTHIFYRWRGWWGKLAAFNAKPSSDERIHPRIARLARTSGLPVMDVDLAVLDQPEPPLEQRPTIAIPGVTETELKGSKIVLADFDEGLFALQLNAAAYPGSYALTANSICKSRPKCIVVGWLKPAFIPASLPIVSSAMLTSTFIYRRNKDTGMERALWNCQVVKRDDSSQCRPGTEPNAGGAGQHVASTTPIAPEQHKNPAN